MVNEANPEIKAFADAMRQSLTNFIIRADPNGPQIPAWPSWNGAVAPALNGPVMHFDRSRCYVNGYLDAAAAIGETISIIDDAFFHTSKTSGT